MARKICKCVATSKIMTFLGATHAAAGHKNLDAPSTGEEKLIHFAEEDEFIKPLVPPSVYARIERDHKKFRREIEQYGDILDEAEFDAHAEYEDDMVTTYLGHLLEQAEAALGGGRAAGLRRDLLQHRASARARTMGRARSF